MIGVQAEGFDELSRVLRDAAERATDEFTKVVGRGALNIKTDWRRRWSGLAHAPAIPYAIGYDMHKGEATIRAVIGPDKAKRQGALGNLLEYGSINNAAIPGGRPALEKEEMPFVKYLEKVAVQLIEEAE